MKNERKRKIINKICTVVIGLLAASKDHLNFPLTAPFTKEAEDKRKMKRRKCAFIVNNKCCALLKQ